MLKKALKFGDHRATHYFDSSRVSSSSPYFAQDVIPRLAVNVSLQEEHFVVDE